MRFNNEELSHFIICLMGPTAAGKTDLAIELLKNYPLEIISVDSAMIYRGMDIGTAKPNKALLELAPHHLIDIRDPSETYSVMQFCQDAIALIKTILAKKRIPLLVGGTMLYFRALQQGLSELPASDALIRKKIERQSQGPDSLYQQLVRVDPAAAARIHPHDPQRIQRALAVYELTGKTLSQWHAEGLTKLHDYPTLSIAIAPASRSLLHARIQQRFHDMLQQGFINEVRSLHARGDLSPDLPSMRAVGYRQAWDYLDNQLSYDEMVTKSIIATRQLAKRQLTWLRTWPNLSLLDSEAPDLAAQASHLIDAFMS